MAELYTSLLVSTHSSPLKMVVFIVLVIQTVFLSEYHLVAPGIGVKFSHRIWTGWSVSSILGASGCMALGIICLFLLSSSRRI